MWSIDFGDDVKKRWRHFEKKHKRELVNVQDNLDTFFRAIEAGAVPSSVKRGFIHSEPKGVLAIDQKGPGGHLKQFRLYVFPDEKTKTLHLIALGDKPSQSSDILQSKRFVEGLRKRDGVADAKDGESDKKKGKTND